MNNTLKNKSIQGKQELLLVSLNNFYQNEANKQKLLDILNGENRISLRIIDWFVTNFSKKNNIHYSLKLRITSPKKNTLKKGLKYSKKDIEKANSCIEVGKSDSVIWAQWIMDFFVQTPIIKTKI